jgi:hypothetical protein
VHSWSKLPTAPDRWRMYLFTRLYSMIVGASLSTLQRCSIRDMSCCFVFLLVLSSYSDPFLIEISDIGLSIGLTLRIRAHICILFLSLKLSLSEVKWSCFSERVNSTWILSFFGIFRTNIQFVSNWNSFYPSSHFWGPFVFTG